MKLYGGNSGKHNGDNGRQNPDENRYSDGQRSSQQRNMQRSPQDQYYYQPKKRRKKKRSGLRKFVTFLIVLGVICGGLFAAYKIWVRPPEQVNDPKPTKTNNPGSSDDPVTSETEGPPASKVSGVYTFLLMGLDKWSENTDTMMVAEFDTNNYTFNVVSVPRDTLVNVDWWLKKANSIYAESGGMGDFYAGMDGLMDGLQDVFGYRVDFFVVVNLEAFITLVDAIGGVEFYVPRDMDYDDPEQDLSIHFEEGLQTLNGQESMEVIRFRKGNYDDGYWNADIGRIETQQKFLKAAVEQIIAKKNEIPLIDLVNIFVNDVLTDLDFGEVLWMAKEFLKMDSASVQFHTIPGNIDARIYGDGDGSLSVVMIYLNDWLELLNDKFNPYDRRITAEDLSILVCDEYGEIYSTDGYIADTERDLGYSENNFAEDPYKETDDGDYTEEDYTDEDSSDGD